MSKLVTIYGGSGFVGRYVTQAMARAGWRVRVACRRPNEALFLIPYGAIGQVELVVCNIRDDASVRDAMRGADAVINCVGILTETGRNRFDAVHDAGARRVARIAADEQVARLVHISALGADAASNSDYARTKAEGEAGVLAQMPNAVILRPSVIFGPEDRFFNRFAGMARYSWVLPVVGANTRFQPVYVNDVAVAAAAAALGRAKAGIYELGGPDVKTFRALMADMCKIIHRRRLIVNVPFFVAGPMARWLGLWQSASMGLFHNNILTLDQVRALHHDIVVHEGANGLSSLGIEATAMDAVLPEYLWRFRPSGQYESIKASAKNLRGLS